MEGSSGRSGMSGRNGTSGRSGRSGMSGMMTMTKPMSMMLTTSVSSGVFGGYYSNYNSVLQIANSPPQREYPKAPFPN
eukprot:7495488-Lingulodinium_polyedra.AAC.1